MKMRASPSALSTGVVGVLSQGFRAQTKSVSYLITISQAGTLMTLNPSTDFLERISLVTSRVHLARSGSWRDRRTDVAAPSLFTQPGASDAQRTGGRVREFSQRHLPFPFVQRPHEENPFDTMGYFYI